MTFEEFVRYHADHNPNLFVDEVLDMWNESKLQVVYLEDLWEASK